MRDRSSFLKVSLLLIVVGLIALAGLTTTNASNLAQATMMATAGSGQGTMAPTMSGGTNAPTGANATTAATMEGTMAATMTPTLEGNEAYPPCPAPAEMMATMESGMAGTMMATMAGTMSSGAAESTAATMSATMMATMAGTMSSGAAESTAATMSATMAAAAGGAMSATMEPGMNVGAFQQTEGCTLTAELAGANEVPGPGDPDGKGTATLTFSRPASGPGTICFQIDASNITLPASAAHIHASPAGIAGPVIIPLSAPDASGKANGCTGNVNRSAIKTMLLYPSQFYVNVHTGDFPNGAIRGQLMPSANR